MATRKNVAQQVKAASPRKAAPKAAVATKAAGIVSAADISTMKAELEGKPTRAAKDGTQSAKKPATALKAATKKLDVKKPAKAPVVKYKGFVIPVARKSMDSDETGIPTIEVKNLTEVIKVASLLPAGCTYLGSGTTLSLYNRGGALIAELRQAAKK